MLWSLIKILFFVAVAAALTYGAGMLIEQGPDVRLTIGTIELTLGPIQAVLVGLAALAVLWVALKVLGLIVAFLRFLNGDETAMTRYFDRNRQRKGYQALGDSLMALAGGEGKRAMAKASKAEQLLQKPELTNLVTAQAAEMVGDTRKAEETYKKLLANDATRFIGVRGIMKQKIAEGDTDTALVLAEKAFALKPKHEEVQDTLLRLQADKHDWKGARKTLGAKLKHGALPRDVHRRRDAVLALSEAKEVFEAGNSIEAREAAIAANKMSPDMIPAAVMAARGYIEQKKPKMAARLLTKAWSVHPHPELAAAFAEIQPGESAKDRVKRFEALTKVQADHPETKMLSAEVLIAAEDFPAARRAMGDLATEAPTSRSLSIMAAIERGMGADDAVVRGYLARATTAPRGPQWVCDNCHNIEATWVPICTNCHAFDTLSWTDPPKSETASPTGTEMLPLIVGSPKAEPAPEPQTADDVGTDAKDDVVEATAEETKPEDATAKT